MAATAKHGDSSVRHASVTEAQHNNTCAKVPNKENSKAFLKSSEHKPRRVNVDAGKSKDTRQFGEPSVQKSATCPAGNEVST